MSNYYSPSSQFYSPTFDSGNSGFYNGSSAQSGFTEFDPSGAAIPSSGMDAAGAFQMAGGIMAIFGAANSAIGTFYQAQSAQNQLKVQAQNERFQSQMSAINAQSAEFSAQQSLLAGEKQIGQYTMRAGQQKSSAVASMAARGIQGGVGSAKEVIGSMDIVKEIDRLTMSASNVRQAEAIRTQAMNYRNQSIMSGLSADNLNTSAGTIYPGLGMATSLIGSAADIGGNWARDNRFEQYLRAQSTKRF